MSDTTDDPVTTLLGPFLADGGGSYLGEPVTQLDHALQTAALAADSDAPAALVVAALLHDVGWLLGATDADHAGRSADFLERWFPAAVTDPVRLHVAAKRWLCTTVPDYGDLLSAASKRTLVLQGGPMVDRERAAFEAQPWSAEAVRLRHWDDEAKVPRRIVPDLDHWRPLIRKVMRPT